MNQATYKTFTATFSEYSDKYVIIGGTATSILLSASGYSTRSTKDYDMVITEEGKNEEFYNVLVSYLEKGAYTSELDTKTQLFRFKTSNLNYPPMIELFCEETEFLKGKLKRITPLTFGTESLSAIIIDSNYYEMLCKNRELINDYSVLSPACMIILKAKAYINISTALESNSTEEGLNTKRKKHRNDIYRLVPLIDRSQNITAVTYSPEIFEDMKEFVERLITEVNALTDTERNIVQTQEGHIHSKSKMCDILKKYLIAVE